MKVLVAIDSFKGSMTSIEAGTAAKKGIKRVIPEAEIVVKPLADGGEGTTDALLEGLGGEKQIVTVTGPMSNQVEASYGILSDGKTAIIEMASASGITLIGSGPKNPLKATSYGTGEMIMDAIRKGCREFIIGIGGSATNDGGMGMLRALGYRFLNSDGQEVGLGAEDLSKVTKVDDSGVPSELKKCHFRIACDVKNPLCGMNGATAIYGPQKGVTGELFDSIEQGMMHYAKVTKAYTGSDYSEVPGTGAAGGLGFAFLAYLGAELISGIDLVMDIVQMENEIKRTDIVVTGEGRMDQQTAMGKVPVGIAKMAKKYNKKVIAFAGGVTKDAIACNEAGIDAFFPIVRGVTTLDEAMELRNAQDNMADTVEQVFRLIQTI